MGLIVVPYTHIALFGGIILGLDDDAIWIRHCVFHSLVLTDDRSHSVAIASLPLHIKSNVASKYTTQTSIHEKDGKIIHGRQRWNLHFVNGCMDFGGTNTPSKGLLKKLSDYGSGSIS